MNRYELINPSDDYTFEAPDDEVADMVTECLGGQYTWSFNGRQGAFAMFRSDKKFDEKARLAEIVARAPEVCAALRSLEIKADQRQRLGVDPDKWHEEFRTSMNDIRRQAFGLAKAVEGIAADAARS